MFQRDMMLLSTVVVNDYFMFKTRRMLQRDMSLLKAWALLNMNCMAVTRDTFQRDMSLLKARAAFHKELWLLRPRDTFHRDMFLLKTVWLLSPRDTFHKDMSFQRDMSQLKAVRVDLGAPRRSPITSRDGWAHLRSSAPVRLDLLSNTESQP